jgi:RNA polymerase sigma factor (sigma-70 family)
LTSDQDARIGNALHRLTEDAKDERAWVELYVCLRPYVFAIAYRHLRGNGGLADDVTQDVFVRLAEAPPFPRLGDPGQLRGYVAAMTRNLAISQVRRLAVDSAREVESLQATEVPPFEKLLALEEILDELKPEDRRLLELVIEGRRLPEVAELLGLSYSAAGVRLHRLRRRIATRLNMQID